MKRLLILVVALCVSTMAMAQKSDSYFSLSGVAKSGGVNLMDFDDEFAFSDVELVYGYHFNDKWSLHVPFTGSQVMNTKWYVIRCRGAKSKIFIKNVKHQGQRVDFMYLILYNKLLHN